MDMQYGHSISSAAQDCAPKRAMILARIGAASVSWFKKRVMRAIDPSVSRKTQRVIKLMLAASTRLHSAQLKAPT